MQRSAEGELQIFPACCLGQHYWGLFGRTGYVYA